MRDACLMRRACPARSAEASGPWATRDGDWIMAMPFHLTVKLGTYLMKQKLRGVKKYPLIMELEPLYACNLKCAGCGKIQQPAALLKQRMSVEQAVAAVEECGAPMVSIAGGEPLM